MTGDAPGGLASPEAIIDEARNGRMFILVDDEDRENEGDLVIPAQMATPDAVNFMARHGRGLICLALSRRRVTELGLDLMSRHNGTRHETAFTVSIEARDGVSTGISAADRARTISVAIDAARGPTDIVTPGHVFPLVARDGGVLVRTGHTEAAVDVARLAGLNPSGVICEIMNDDGTMARMDDLIPFAAAHGLRIGTIRDLIAYRMRYDRLVERRAETRFVSRWGGEWTSITFYNQATGEEMIAIVKGTIDPARPTLVRMHTILPFADLFGEASGRFGVLARAMTAIADAGAGVIVVINRHGPDVFSRLIRSREATAGDHGETLRLWRRCADPERVRRPRHDPADRHPAEPSRARRLWPVDRQPACDQRGYPARGVIRMQPTSATRDYRFVRYFPRVDGACDHSCLGPYQWLTTIRAPRMIDEAVALWRAIAAADGTASEAIAACEAQAAVRGSTLASPDPNLHAGKLLAVIARRARKLVPDTPQRALQWATYGTAAGQPRLGDILCTIGVAGASVGLYVGEDSAAFHCLGGIAGDRVGVERIGKQHLYAVRRPLYEGMQYSANGIRLQVDGSRASDG